MGYRVGIDSGGTFTDLLAINDAGDVEIIKVPSTPQNPDIGFRNAVEALINDRGIPASDIETILHGTTVAVNAILQRNFPDIGLLTTKGFRHILELARQTVPGERGSIYVWVKPPRIVPLKNVREITERLDSKGGVMTPFDDTECREAARWYRDNDIGTVAICFINAYASGDHERRARDIFKEEFPDCFVAISSETLPEYREYERAVTTSMNALLMPILGQYVRELQTHLGDLGVDAPLYVMKSAGGASRADFAIENPVYTALSGPAAAVVGSAWLGRNAGHNDLITFDMGGTSTDVSLVEGGFPALVSETEIDVYPVRAPSIDVISVGAGGGSLAWLAPGDRLRVGPKSAGADPGPACYGGGGMEPTITDANLFLGRLSTSLAGGTVMLDRRLSEAALARLGKEIGLSPVELAFGIIEIGEMNMADAIRQVSVQKGRDPRLFSLVASGGAGPLHGCSLGEILHIPRVLIPPSPGIGCSLGALVSDVREDFVHTDIQREADADIARIRDQFMQLEKRAIEALSRQGFDESNRSIVRSADLRYRGMRTELTVFVGEGEFNEALVAEMFDALHDAHDSAYGYAYRGVQQVELVNVRVAGLGKMLPVEPFAAMSNGGDLKSAQTAQREIYIGPLGWVDTPIYDRTGLSGGMTFAGPAVIEQYDTTCLILPGQSVTVDSHGNLIVEMVGDVGSTRSASEKVGASA